MARRRTARGRAPPPRPRPGRRRPRPAPRRPAAWTPSSLERRTRTRAESTNRPHAPPASRRRPARFRSQCACACVRKRSGSAAGARPSAAAAPHRRRQPPGAPGQGSTFTVRLPAAAGSILRAMALTIRSPSFADGGEIPSRHTCEGADTLPAARVLRRPRRRAEPGAGGGRPRRARPARAEDGLRPLGAPRSAARRPPACRRAPRQVAPARRAPGPERLPAQRLERPMPANRSPPLLLQAPCARRRAGRPGARHQVAPPRGHQGHVLAEAQLMGTYQKRGGG